MLIAISGYARAGKDTVADRLCDVHGWERLAFADLLRECAKALNPIVGQVLVELPMLGTDKVEYLETDGLVTYQESLERYGYDKSKELYPEFRGILQRLGTDVGRRLLDDNIWVDATLAKCEEGKNYVFTDARFPNEATAISGRGGRVVRVERPGVGPANDHPSETSLDDWPFDAVYQNDGTIDDLNAWVDEHLAIY